MVVVMGADCVFGGDLIWEKDYGNYSVHGGRRVNEITEAASSVFQWHARAFQWRGRASERWSGCLEL